MQRRSRVLAASLSATLPYINRGLGRAHSIQMDSACGSWLTDVSGKKYLDFVAGIGVTNLGHCHPRLVQAVQDQAGKLWHGQTVHGLHTPYVDFVNEVRAVLPPSLDNIALFSTGAEAVEASVKLAQHATKRHKCIVMLGGYHGRTKGTLALTTSKSAYGVGYSPFQPGVLIAPFPYYSTMKLPQSTSEDVMVDMCLSMLQDMLKMQTSPSEVASILVEPLLGEGGYVPCPPRYFQGLRQICDEHGILLICDEVQSGFGRTGSMFLCDQLGAQPDVIVFAKGVANGLPLSGIATRKELGDTQVPGSQGGTYAGNALACRAAVEVLKIFREEDILGNVEARSRQLVDKLKELRRSRPYGSKITDIRGKGLMIGMQFDDNCSTASADVVKHAYDRGLLLLNCSAFQVVRFMPPLTVSEQEMDQALDILDTSLTAALK